MTQRKITDLKDVPKEVVHILQHEFAEGFALRESMVEAVCGVLGGIHQWMHPVASDLEPGQAV